MVSLWNLGKTVCSMFILMVARCWLGKADEICLLCLFKPSASHSRYTEHIFMTLNHHSQRLQRLHCQFWIATRTIAGMMLNINFSGDQEVSASFSKLFYIGSMLLIRFSGLLIRTTLTGSFILRFPSFWRDVNRFFIIDYRKEW